MTAKWRDCQLGDVLTLQRGFDITKAQQKPGTVPVVSSSGINSFHSDAMVEAPGVVIGRKGSLGTCFYLDEAFWPHDTTLWVKDFKGNDPTFCYYFLKGMDLAKHDVGSANPTLNRNHVHLLPVVAPDQRTQQRIAAILGAYDDLIEVNRRQVAVLEEMARGLFEEWFVRFRFSGHEDVPIVDTPDGPLPEGWEFEPIGDAFDILGGGTPSKKVEEYWTDGTVDWYTPSDLTGTGSLFMDRSALRITEAGLAKSSAKLFPADSIMMTSRATLGVISICTGPASTNQGFITALPNERLPRTYLYHWLRQNVPLFIAHATGATFKEITKGVFKKLKVTVPSREVIEHYEKIARPMHDMVLALERSNRSLAASRDLLLPRLISGQLPAEAAERELEDAA